MGVRVFVAWCLKCQPRKKFKSWVSQKIARDQHNRHLREQHKHKHKLNLARRREQQANYNKVYRAKSRGPLRACGTHSLLETSVLCRVLCPARREREAQLWTLTHAVLRAAGFESVERDLGWDFKTGEGVPSWLPGRLRASGVWTCTLDKSKWLHVWFENRFLPMALARFRKDAALQFIAYVEDDCIAKPGGDAAATMAIAVKHAPSASWVGYAKVGGVPRYGSHFVVLTRDSARWLLRHSVSQRKEKAPWQHYVGLDTFLHSVVKGRFALAGGDAVVKTSDEALWGQRTHALAGRQ